MSGHTILLGALLARLALPAAAAEAPFLIEETKTVRDAAAINESFRAAADNARKISMLNGGTVAGEITLEGTGNGVTFPDGSRQTSSITSYASTRTFIAANTTAISNAAMNIGIAGSTVTLTTTHTARHQFLLTTTIRQGNAGDHLQCGVLQNGAFIDGQGNAVGLWVGHGQGTPSFYNLGSTWTTASTYAAGTYNYTVVCGIDANSFQFCSSAVGAATGRCFFEVRELPY